jgi:hypothetical protein
LLVRIRWLIRGLLWWSVWERTIVRIYLRFWSGRTPHSLSRGNVRITVLGRSSSPTLLAKTSCCSNGASTMVTESLHLLVPPLHVSRDVESRSTSLFSSTTALLTKQSIGIACFAVNSLDLLYCLGKMSIRMIGTIRLYQLPHLQHFVCPHRFN